jgi:membrane protease YdiL (CAAX protease family)
MSPYATTRARADWTGMVLPALFVLLFGVCLHQARWLSLLLLALGIGLVVIRLIKYSNEDIETLFGFRPCRWRWVVLAAIIGLGLGMLLRWEQNRSLVPLPMHGFVFMAMLIGISEELVFRGYFMGVLLQRGFPMAAIVTALLHTAYKLPIFIPFADASSLPVLGALTFGVGALAGWSRKVLGSIWPCVVLHALFDLWVYGDRTTPWWVW